MKDNEHIFEGPYMAKMKAGTHLSRSKEDGSHPALMFDENQRLQGPVDLIEVDVYEPSTIERIKEAVFSYCVMRALEIGIQNVIYPLCKDKVIPMAKKKTKETVEKIKPIAKGTVDALLGKELILDSVVSKKCEQTKPDMVAHTEACFNMSPEEAKKLLLDLQRIARSLAACVDQLTQEIVVDDKEGRQEDKAKLQMTYKELVQKQVLNTISLLLEEKNQGLLDQREIAILSDFQSGKILINGEYIPISRYFDKEIIT